MSEITITTVSLLIIALHLAVLVALAALYFRTAAENINLDRLITMSRTYFLGNTLALRPYQSQLIENPKDWTEYNPTVLYEPKAIREHVRWPLALCIFTIFTISFILLIAFNWKYYTKPSMLLSGANLEHAKDATYQLGSLKMIQFAFLAAYVWALWQLFQRMVDRDVTVYAFHIITIRVITTIILALTIYHGFSGKMPWSDQGGGANSSFDIFMIIAFGIGFFPEVALRWIGAKARAWFQSGEPSSYLDIETIEGIDTFTRARLAEAGIADANGLAASNPVTLAIRTPYALPELVDWAGQAQLLVLLKKEIFDKLRLKGIRTSYQFYDHYCDQAGLSVNTATAAAPATAAADPTATAAAPAAAAADPTATAAAPATTVTTTDGAGVPGFDVRTACASLNKDPSFRRLQELVDKMLQ